MTNKSEALREQLESIRNTLMGITFDPRLNSEIKGVIDEKATQLDSIIDELEKGDGDE